MSRVSLASTRGVLLPCQRYRTQLLVPHNVPHKAQAKLAAPKAVSELAGVAATVSVSELANALTTSDVSEFLLEHPVATFACSVAALFLVPKLIEAFVRYLAAPVAIALLAFYTVENPESSAALVTTVLSWVNNHPEVTSVVVVGLALFGLAPALLTALGATALIYALLSLSFGTQLPEVREMQGEFGETVSRVQFLTNIASMRFQQLTK